MNIDYTLMCALMRRRIASHAYAVQQEACIDQACANFGGREYFAENPIAAGRATESSLLYADARAIYEAAAAEYGKAATAYLSCGEACEGIPPGPKISAGHGFQSQHPEFRT